VNILGEHPKIRPAARDPALHMNLPQKLHRYWYIYIYVYIIHIRIYYYYMYVIYTVDIDNSNILWWVWDQVSSFKPTDLCQEKSSGAAGKITETQGDSRMFGGYPWSCFIKIYPKVTQIVWFSHAWKMVRSFDQSDFSLLAMPSADWCCSMLNHPRNQGLNKDLQPLHISNQNAEVSRHV